MKEKLSIRGVDFRKGVLGLIEILNTIPKTKNFRFVVEYRSEIDRYYILTEESDSNREEPEMPIIQQPKINNEEVDLLLGILGACRATNEIMLSLINRTISDRDVELLQVRLQAIEDEVKKYQLSK